MFKHSLLLAYRTFKKYKSSFFINLIGLSTGLACALLIYLWVHDELSVDQFHEKKDRLYQVMENRKQSDGIVTSPTTSFLLAETLADEMPEVEYAASATLPFKATLAVGESSIKAPGQYVGKDYFNILSYNLVQGNKDQVLSDKSAIVISESLAIKLFRTTENIIGKTLKFQQERNFRVSGIFEDLPDRSSEQFDFLLPYELFKDIVGDHIEWRNTNPATLLILKKGTSVASFNAKIADLVKVKTNNEVDHRSLFVVPYANNYLYGRYENGVQAGGRIDYVKLFSIVALFMLAIACVNFMNLSTAKSSRRLKEVGVKKAIGASRKLLIFQYLGESVSMAFLSLLVALVLVLLFLPQFNEITGKQLSLSLNLQHIFVVLGITFFTGLIAGSYPALYLSGFNTVAVLKGGRGLYNDGNSSALGKLRISIGELVARKGLVIFQFTLSMIFMVAVFVVYKQISFVQNKNLGFSKDNIIYFEREGNMWEDGNLETFLAEVEKTPGILSASSIAHDLTGHNGGTWGIEWKGKDPDDKTEFERGPVHYEIMELLELELEEGRFFSKDFSTDSSKIIFNEAAIQFMGMQNPVGETVKLWGEEMEIIGVVKNFHFESLHETVKPMFFILRPEWTNLIMAKMEAGKEQETLAGLQVLYSNFNPDFPFDYKFLDQEYQAQYVAEQRVATLSRYFAGIAILISCLGLYGLAAFSAEQRRKEIGIRKVLGASVANIMTLLSKDFVKLVFMAIVIGSVLAWIAMNKWLEGFAYRINISWWMFAAAGSGAFIIALLTVSIQAIRSARANPVKNLRTE